jgi:CheY-like chemotaxis protein
MPPEAGSTSAQPLLLLANGDEMYRRSLESVLTQGGYRVVTADSGDDALVQARRHRPDGIILDVELARPRNYAMCRALRADPAVALATPIVLTTAGRATRAQQLDALRAGAWELRGDPLDTEELLLRLAAYVQGKLEVDRLGTEGLVDRASGLYNAAGVARRAEELAALTARQGLALACAVFRLADGVQNGDDGDRLALAFKHAGRISDAIGRTGPMEFAVFAPATDGPAAARLVTRLADSVSRAFTVGGGGSPAVSLRAGYSAAAAAARMDPGALLARARAALDAPPLNPKSA